MEPRCLSAKDAAAYCGVPVTTPQRHGPRPLLIGKHRVYDLTLLNEWIDQLSGRTGSPSSVNVEEARLLALIKNG